jgi:hypothetical protein
VLNFIALYWPQGWKKDTIWEAKVATLGAHVPAFINILTSMLYHLLVTWDQQQARNAQSWPQVVGALTPSVNFA